MKQTDTQTHYFGRFIRQENMPSSCPVYTASDNTNENSNYSYYKKRCGVGRVKEQA